MRIMEKSLMDIFWVLICAGLVFLMQAGFTCLESGLTRSKNSINVAIKNITDFGISTILFWAFGFALMFGTSHGTWIGSTGFLLPLDEGTWPTTFFLFELMFCATAVTIVSGATAERLRFGSYIIISIISSGLIYPTFGHWAWNGAQQGIFSGWLGMRGFVDFAGSTVVHSVGGWISLAALLVIGPREGRFPKVEVHKKIHGSNLPFSVLGVLLLWIGWFGFNGGSAIASGALATSAFVVTHIAAASAALSWLMVEWLKRGKPTMLGAASGCVAGLVAITPASGFVGPMAALLIGAGAGALCYYGVNFKNKFGFDDSLDAVGVHGVGGTFGAIATGIFASKAINASGADGLLLGNVSLVGTQLLSVAVAAAFSFVMTWLILKVLELIMGLRVDDDQEVEGLDLSQHGESGYMF